MMHFVTALRMSSFRYYDGEERVPEAVGVPVRETVTSQALPPDFFVPNLRPNRYPADNLEAFSLC
jgi:hypothetical protein